MITILIFHEMKSLDLKAIFNYFVSSRVQYLILQASTLITKRTPIESTTIIHTLDLYFCTLEHTRH